MEVNEGPEGLRDSHQRWLKAVEHADLDGYVDLVVEDVVWIPPSGDAVQGRAAFRSWLEPFFEAYAYAMTIREADVRVAGEWAIENGVFSNRMTPRAGGEAMEHAGRFVALWHHEIDGRWRIDRYLDNSMVE